MWHVETDFLVLAIFLIMLIKEWARQREEKDVQGRAFFQVLIISIFNVLVDILSSIAMNNLPNWWSYQLLMTLYVTTMPLLAAVWLAYAYVLIYKDRPLIKLRRNILLLMIPYFFLYHAGADKPVHRAVFPFDTRYAVFARRSFHARGRWNDNALFRGGIARGVRQPQEDIPEK